MIGKFECEIDLTAEGWDQRSIADMLIQEVRDEMRKEIRKLVREQVRDQKDGILKRIQATLDAIEIDVTERGDKS